MYEFMGSGSVVYVQCCWGCVGWAVPAFCGKRLRPQSELSGSVEGYELAVLLGGCLLRGE